MDVKSLVMVSGRFMQTFCGYKLYVTAPRNEAERKGRHAKRRRRNQTLQKLKIELKECLQPVQ